jgi:hypothetical protein
VILQWAATGVVLALFGLNLMLPYTAIGRRGTETKVRLEVEEAMSSVGESMPAFSLPKLDGDYLDSVDLLGHRVLLTFERSVDW